MLQQNSAGGALAYVALALRFCFPGSGSVGCGTLGPVWCVNVEPRKRVNCNSAAL